MVAVAAAAVAATDNGKRGKGKENNGCLVRRLYRKGWKEGDKKCLEEKGVLQQEQGVG